MNTRIGARLLCGILLYALSLFPTSVHAFEIIVRREFGPLVTTPGSPFLREQGGTARFLPTGTPYNIPGDRSLQILRYEFPGWGEPIEIGRPTGENNEWWGRFTDPAQTGFYGFQVGLVDSGVANPSEAALAALGSTPVYPLPSHVLLSSAGLNGSTIGNWNVPTGGASVTVSDLGTVRIPQGQFASDRWHDGARLDATGLTPDRAGLLESVGGGVATRDLQFRFDSEHATLQFRDPRTGNILNVAGGPPHGVPTSIVNETLPQLASRLQSPGGPQVHCAVVQKDRIREEIPRFEQQHERQFPQRGSRGIREPDLANGRIHSEDATFEQAKQHHHELIDFLDPADPTGQPPRTPQRPKNTLWQAAFVEHLRTVIFGDLQRSGSRVSARENVKFVNVEGEMSDAEVRANCPQGPGNPLGGQDQPTGTTPTIPTPPTRPQPQPPTSPIENPGGGPGGGGGGGLLQSLLPQLLQSLFGQKQGGGAGSTQQPTPPPPLPTPQQAAEHHGPAPQQSNEIFEGFLRNGIPKSLIEQVVLSVMNLFLNTLSGQIPVTTVPGDIPETIVGG